MNGSDIDDLTTAAVTAALAVIDAAGVGHTKKSRGPCGDALAAKLHTQIRRAIAAAISDGEVQPPLRLDEV